MTTGSLQREALDGNRWRHLAVDVQTCACWSGLTLRVCKGGGRWARLATQAQACTRLLVVGQLPTLTCGAQLSPPVHECMPLAVAPLPSLTS